MSFTRGLLVVRMPQAFLPMFTLTSCVLCTKSSHVLNAPTHLQKSLESVGFIATLRCAKLVKLSTGYFEEIPRNFSLRLPFGPRLLHCWGTGLLNCRRRGLTWNFTKSQGKSPWALLEIFLGQLHGYSTGSACYWPK